MKLARIVGLGIGLWVLPLGSTLLLAPLCDPGRSPSQNLSSIVIVVLAVSTFVFWFRDLLAVSWRTALVAGIAWPLLATVVDLPVALLVVQLALVPALTGTAVTYLLFPAITTGIALVQGWSAPRRRPDPARSSWSGWHG